MGQCQGDLPGLPGLPGRPRGSPNTHQPKNKPLNIRRGESGGERKGGPLWSPAGWGVIVLPQDWSKMNRYAGDHKGPPNPTSSALAPTDHPASALEIIHRPTSH